MLGFRSEIHRAPEYIQNAPVHVVAHFAAQVGVEGLGVPASELGHLPYSHPV
jgi:hypothetical protein